VSFESRSRREFITWTGWPAKREGKRERNGASGDPSWGMRYMLPPVVVMTHVWPVNGQCPRVQNSKNGGCTGAVGPQSKKWAKEPEF
jgi:hypothetical protein